MKKLMMMVAVVCAAVAVQAAGIEWAASNGALNDYKGMTVYCINGGSLAKALEKLSDGGVNIGTEFPKIVMSSATVSDRGAIKAVYSEIEKDSTTAAWIIISGAIEDGSAYYATTALDVSSYLYTPPSSTPGTFKIKGADFTTKGTIGAVPEPTSGLLLLLGMAGLALKRKMVVG